jgi:hypothetical protein
VYIFEFGLVHVLTKGKLPHTVPIVVEMAVMKKEATRWFFRKKVTRFSSLAFAQIPRRMT